MNFPDRLACALWMSVSVLVGCTQPGETGNDLAPFAADYAAAWSGQDSERFASFYSEGGSLRVNEDDPAVGRDAVAALAQGYMTALPDMVVSLDSLVVVDGVPRFHWTLDATDSGPGGTGNRIHISGYEEWTLDEDGLIVRSQGHMDSGEYRRQVEHGASED